MLADELHRYTELYAPAYRDGHLLVSGGISAQPARYLALVGEIRRLDTKSDETFEALTAENTEGTEP